MNFKIHITQTICTYGSLCVCSIWLSKPTHFFLLKGVWTLVPLANNQFYDQEE